MRRRRFSQTFEYPTIWGYTSEVEMYNGIWNSRPHVSFISGLPITNPSPKNFLHVLPKALDQYPEFRLNPDNVILGVWEEHELLDAGTVEGRRRYSERVKSADFAAVDLLRTKLRREYEDMFEK